MKSSSRSEKTINAKSSRLNFFGGLLGKIKSKNDLNLDESKSASKLTLKRVKSTNEKIDDQKTLKKIPTAPLPNEIAQPPLPKSVKKINAAVIEVKN
jgi:hypothetical protein